MELLTLNNSKKEDHKQQKERVKQTRAKVEEANKPLPLLFEELMVSLKKPLDEKEKDLFKLAKGKLLSGEVSRTKTGKLTKTEIIELGKKIKSEIEEKKRFERIKDVLENKPSNFHILTCDSQIPHFISRLEQECELQREKWKDRWSDLGVESLMAWDFEGTGIDWFQDLPIGFSCWLPLINEGYYLPYLHVYGINEANGVEIPREFQFKETDPQLTRSKVIKSIVPYMTKEKEGKSFHMGAPRYDLHISLNDGYEIKGCVFDSLNAMYLMNEKEESYGLKNLIKKYGKYFGIEHEIYTFDDLFGNCSPAPFNTELVGIYAIYDVYYGWKLTEWQIQMMKKTDNLWKCYTLIDSKLPETDCFLQRSGFDIDLAALSELGKEFEHELEKAKSELFETYRIDHDFVQKMNLTINKNKIEKWQQEQRERIRKWKDKKEKLENEIKELDQQGKSHLKLYKNKVDQYMKQCSNRPVPAKPEFYPNPITEFELTNRNHIGYLIYDHLGIKDITPKLEPGKKRGTSRNILDKYFEEEESLKPLANVSKFEKLVSTYTKSIPEKFDADGRLHSLFDSSGTTTGRYASKGYSGRPIELLKQLQDEFGGIN